MKVKYCVRINEMGGNYINECGTLEVKNMGGYGLYQSLMRKTGGDDSLSKKEFDECIEVIKMGDWVLMGDVDGVENYMFVK